MKSVFKLIAKPEFVSELLFSKHVFNLFHKGVSSKIISIFIGIFEEVRCIKYNFKFIKLNLNNALNRASIQFSLLIISSVLLFIQKQLNHKYCSN